MQMPSALILAVTLEPHRTWWQSLAVQSAGYAVISAYSVQEAITRLQFGDFDLVVLDDSIRAKDRDCLVLSIRRSGSHIPIVCIKAAGSELAASAQSPTDYGQTEFIDLVKNALLEADDARLKMETADPCAHCAFKRSKTSGR